jgi:hypothetical protein
MCVRGGGCCDVKAGDHRLQPVTLGGYMQSAMMDAISVPPPPGWVGVWVLGTLALVALGLTVLVAVPGSFLIPLMVWTPLVMKLGAPPDADEVRRSLLPACLPAFPAHA